MRIELGKHFYAHRNLPFSAQRCVNRIPEIGARDTKSELVLLTAPGLVRFATCGAGPIRGASYRPNETKLFVVSGNSAYVAYSNGATTKLTGSIDGVGPVMMADSGADLVAVAEDTRAYVIGNTTVTEITDPDFPGASSVATIDGYHIFTEPATGRFFISSLLDAESYDALDFASAESAPDNLVRIIVDHREVWLFGQETTEVWTNSGSPDFPFKRMEGVFVEKGCAAKHSVAKIDNSVFWLADDRMVYRAAGYQPQRISTHAIEDEIVRYGDVSDAEAWTYAASGHTYYILTFPSADRTFCYDVATGLWHERMSGVEEYGRWRARCGVGAFDAILVGDDRSGNIYTLDDNAFSENGELIRRIMVTPQIFAEGRLAVMHRLEMICDVGRGLEVGQGSDPQISLRKSDDGGLTWGNERWRSLGKIGEHRKRVCWERLGKFRQRCLMFSNSDPIRSDIVMLTAEIEGLSA